MIFFSVQLCAPLCKFLIFVTQRTTDLPAGRQGTTKGHRELFRIVFFSTFQLRKLKRFLKEVCSVRAIDQSH
jgi:hypothetical protein